MSLLCGTGWWISDGQRRVLFLTLGIRMHVKKRRFGPPVCRVPFSRQCRGVPRLAFCLHLAGAHLPASVCTWVPVEPQVLPFAVGQTVNSPQLRGIRCAKNRQACVDLLKPIISTCAAMSQRFVVHVSYLEMLVSGHSPG